MPPIHVMIKPASAACNLACHYCFYKDEASLRQLALRGLMSQATAQALVQKALAHAEASCTFAFQGGEPSLAGLAFFEQFVQLVNQHNTRKLAVHYAFQTNGILIDQAWARFFAKNNFLVGLSLDGTAAVHDPLRPFSGGEGSHSRVLAAARCLEAQGVEFNILTVVTKPLVQSLAQVFDFFKQQGFYFQQYIPCLDPFEGPGGGWSLSVKDYSKFLHRLFVLWQAGLGQPDYVSIRQFENWVMLLRGQPPESCSMRGVCSVQYVAEGDGAIYPCDFYCLDQWELGNANTHSFAQLDEKRQQLGFIQRSLPVPIDCKACRWQPLCRSGCPRERQQLQDAFGKNRYCQAYQEFFSLHLADLERIARLP